ncbi:M48 family metalloprotease [Pseudomonas sp. p1(2021b)]|uniref:M48 family metallopeptidase n=1 Tax=Pseudomonas sp. p1(2021b) TaxID=2874628 RepID=UPI001CCB0B8D|nr:M48 family metallopeptidase [Pseudomonas sp. p1(2021b)]UBM25501.1 M48 family metalloprotease [Pseudomonas sp. p1(2021b)]
MTSRDKRTLAWRLVLLPLLLMAMAIWQGQRADAHRSLLLEEQAKLHGFIADVTYMETVNDRRLVEFNGKSHEPYVAHSLAVNWLGYVERELGFAKVGTWLPHFSLRFSILLILLGIASLLAFHWAGKAALQSRDRLVRLFFTLSQVLPVVLVACILLLTLTVVLEIGYEALWLFALQPTSAGVIKLQLLVGLLMLAMLWPLYRLPGQLKDMLQLFKTEPHDIYGGELAEQQAPALWARVRGLAKQLDALEPDNIVVGFLDGFYVTSSDVLLYPGERRLQGRTLYLPLPLLAVLSRSESDAVIAHELAHFSGEDTEYSMRFMPIYQGAGRNIGVVGGHMEAGMLQGLLTLPAYALAVHFMQRFDFAVSHWSRKRELQADAAGARVGGPQAVVDSLVRISALEPLIEQHQAELCMKPQAWPEDLLAATLEYLATQDICLSDDELADELAHPSDSHPPTRQRILALGLSVENARGGEALRPVVPAQALAWLAEQVPDLNALSRALGAAIGSRLLEQRNEVHEYLLTRAEAVTGDCMLHEGAQWRGRFLVAVGIACLGAALWVRFGSHVQGGKPGLVSFLSFSALFIVAVGLWAGVQGWRMVRRAATPAMIFTPHSVRFANTPEPIPLHRFDQYMIKVSPRLSVGLKLADDAPLPLFNKRRFWEPDARLDAKTRWVSLALGRWSIGGKGLKAGELAALVERYLEAGAAREALQAFEAPTGPTDGQS